MQMTKNLLDNPYFIILFSIVAIFLNTLFTSHFLLLLFSGFLFLAFYKTLKNRYLYSLLVVIFTFTIIEYNIGLKLFTLSIISLFLYVFILPFVDKINAFSKFNNYVYMIIFYGVLHSTWGMQTSFTEVLFFSLLTNLIIDIILVGVLIWQTD